MVVACPPLGGPGGRRCGCRPRSGSRRGLRRRRWRGGCGSHVIRRTCGGGAGGRAAQAALASRGPGGAACRLSGAQLERLRAALEAGPAVWGWAEDQRWTLERVAAADRAAVPRQLYRARDVVPAAPPGVHPAGPGAPGRGARRGRDRGVAGGDLGEGTRLAAVSGAWIVLRGRGRAEPAPAEGPDLGAPRPDPGGPRVRQGLRAGLGGGTGVPEARRAGPPVLPGPDPPRAQGRAPLDVRS